LTKRNKSQGLRKNKLKIIVLSRNEKAWSILQSQTLVRLTGYEYIPAFDHCFHSPSLKLACTDKLPSLLATLGPTQQSS
jgi:hypothetical protein